MAQTATPITTTVNGNTLNAKIQLSSQIEIDVILSFENAIGLSADNIDISATLVSTNDVNILSRLPASGVSLFSSFPVILSISPKQDKGFGFEGLGNVEIYTKAISYNANMPARLFTAHNGGDFEDITSMVSAGSIRARGSTGRFSDFLIVLDERSKMAILSDKFDELEHVLVSNQALVNASLLSSLQTSLNSLDLTISLANYNDALTLVNGLISVIESAENDAITTVWRSSGDVVNVQGELLAHLKAMRYNLRVL
jgi:hypothetical protein